MKKMRIFQRPHSASLGDTPKSQAKGEKRAAPSTPQEKTPKRGKGGPSPSYAQVTKSQAPNKEEDWQVVTKRGEKNKKRIDKKLKKKAKDPVEKAQGTVAKLKSKRSTPARSGDVIKVSARDGQSYVNILKEMKAKVDPRKARLEVLSIRRTCPVRSCSGPQKGGRRFGLPKGA